MVSLRAALLLCALAAAADASYDIRRVLPRTTEQLETESIPVAPYSIPFSAKVPRSTAKKNVLAALTQGNLKGWNNLNGLNSSFSAPLSGVGGDSEYAVNATIGGQHFLLLIDTGSSDTWVPVTDFGCVNLTGYAVPQSECGFGPLFDPSASPTFETDLDKNFNIHYGGGEFLTGTVGFETVTVGGMTVQSQEIGVVNSAAWNGVGDGVTSGLIGLAYPDLVRIYNGTNITQDVSQYPGNNHAGYNPLFFSAVQDGVVQQPYFSLALNRGTFDSELNDVTDANLGYLAFGGVASVPTSAIAATVPVEGFNITANGTLGYLYWSINVSSYNFVGTSTLTGSGLRAIIDAGTTLNYLPSDIAAEYNSRFIPPATYNADYGLYTSVCNATVPPFSVTIGGVEFAMDARDNLSPLYYDANGDIVCMTSTQDGGGSNAASQFILGQAFLHNVVATFNIKANTVTLAERLWY